MKLAKLIAVAAVALSAYSASAQSGGTLTFTTFGGAGGEVFDVGGSTALGTGFLGQIYTSPTANGTFLAAGAPTQFGAVLAGYIFYGTTVASPNVAVGGNGFYEIRAWTASAGATFEIASTVAGAHVGSSAATAASGTFGGPQASGPPAIGPSVNNFANFNLSVVTAVPEPSTLALGIVGVAGLLAMRRRQ